MNFSSDSHDVEQTRRFRHRSILFFIILATLPCYIVGAIMLGVAPQKDSESPTIMPGPSTRQSGTGTSTATFSVPLTPSITRQATQTQGPIINTPGQFRPRTNTPFPTQPIATATLAPTITSSPIASPTATSTQTPSNQNPIFTTAPQGQTLGIGETRTVNFAFSDPDGDPVSFTAVSDNPAIVSISSFDASAFNILGLAQGNANITVTLNDNRGGSASSVIAITVTAPNNNPIFTTEPLDVVVNQGGTSTVNLMFTDPDSDPVSFTAVSANTAIATTLQLSPVSFQVNGIAEGSTTITVTLTDSRGGTATRVINVTVNSGAGSNHNPVFNQEPLPVAITQGDSDIELLQVSDPDGDPLILTVTSSNPAVIFVDEIDHQSFTVQGMATGNAVITIVISDNRGGVTQRIINATVSTP